MAVEEAKGRLQALVEANPDILRLGYAKIFALLRAEGLRFREKPLRQFIKELRQKYGISPAVGRASAPAPAETSAEPDVEPEGEPEPAPYEVEVKVIADGKVEKAVITADKVAEFITKNTDPAETYRVIALDEDEDEVLIETGRRKELLSQIRRALASANVSYIVFKKFQPKQAASKKKLKKSGKRAKRQGGGIAPRSSRKGQHILTPPVRVNPYENKYFRIFVPAMLFAVLKAFSEQFSTEFYAEVPIKVFDKDKGIIIADDKVIIPDQSVSGAFVSVETSLYNAVGIHIHPADLDTFSGTDETSVNAKTLISGVITRRDLERGVFTPSDLRVEGFKPAGWFFSIAGKGEIFDFGRVEGSFSRRAYVSSYYLPYSYASISEVWGADDYYDYYGSRYKFAGAGWWSWRYQDRFLKKDEKKKIITRAEEIARAMVGGEGK